MNIVFIIAVVSLTLQFGTTAALLILGRAPRWRRVRWFGVVAFTAGCYSTVDAIAALRQPGAADVSWDLRMNLFLATLHAGAWLIFTHMGPSGRWGTLPRWVRNTVAGSAALSAIGSLTGVVASAERQLISVPALGVHFELSTMTPVGNAVALAAFIVLLLSAAAVWRERKQGTQGATFVLFGFGLFVAAALEELLVAAGVVNFIFLGDLGYVCVVVPVTLQLFRRFRDDADQLDLLTDHLADEVKRRTDERDHARGQMIEQQRLAALGRLAAGVGHEINNPLQYLRFTLEDLRECAKDMQQPDALRMIEHSFDGIERIRQVVEDLRTYARPHAAQFAPLDLREVVKTALRVASPQSQQGIAIDIELAAVPLVQGHEGRLVQVVLNPLVNGIQAMKNAGRADRSTMRVRTGTTADGWAEVEITDQGPGFDNDVVSRLGEPYVTTKSLQGGTGLGLFVSRGIVEAHDGRMEFANAPDGGAIVRVQLPPSAAGAASTTPAVPGNAAGVPTATTFAQENAGAERAVVAGAPRARAGDGMPLRVLMVEDDEQALKALVRGLRMEGIDATGFAQGRSALEWLTEHLDKVDLVVTDLMMPGMSGWEFAAELAAAHPSLRRSLVVLTGGASTSEAVDFLRDDSLLVLAKPIGRQAFAEALRQRAGSAAAAAAGRG
jgi:signal transduction histidine kinase/ActR/RegA family two-component response regulator